MRFSLWSQSHETSLAPGTSYSNETHNYSNSKHESSLVVKKSARKNSKVQDHVVGIKSRGRYDIPEGTKKSNKRADARNDVESYPIIDRIPTAIGYLSDGSDEEWLEEKSRVSRYDISDAPIEDDLEVDEDDDERDDPMEEIEEESNDKYSRKIASTKKKSNLNQSDNISRLWSESTDSEIDDNERKTDQEIAIDAKLDREEIASYAEEKGSDPIYDGSPKNREKGKSGKERKSPNNNSDTSSKSDNLKKMLHYATTSDQVVKEIEEKIKLLKAVAAEEYEYSKRQQEKERKKEKSKRSKKEGRPSKRDDLKSGKMNKKGKRDATIKTKSTSKKVKTVDDVSCDGIELTRSISLGDSNLINASRLAVLNSITQFFHKKKTTADSVIDGISTCPSNESNDKTETGSIKSGRPTTAMYTKSLISEDSENDPVEKSVLSISAQTQKHANEEKVSSRAEMKLGADVASRKNRIGSLLAHTRNFGFKSRSSYSNAKDGKRRSGVFFWKKHDHRSSLKEDQLLEESSSYQGAKQSAGPNSPRSKQNDVKEMDEYSKSTKDMNVNEPDLVQCLRFFQCGSMANQVSTAIAAASCGGANSTPHEDDHIDDNFDILESDHLAPESSNPTVEVVLKDGLKSSSEVNAHKGTPLSCGNSLSCQNDIPDPDDFLIEAPGLPMSRVPSIVLDVSDMQLHLDGDSEADRMAHSVSIGGNRSRSELSITSINVPVFASHSEEDDENDKKSKAVKLSRTIPRKGIKIRSIFSRFVKK